MPASYKNKTSAKSLRIGLNTTLAMHRDITFHMQQSRGGWSTGSRSDIYQEICPDLTYYAGACLSGWDHCSKIINPPNLECLGLEEQQTVHSFIKQLYLYDNHTMPQFSPEGHMWPFICTVTASILRFHEQFILNYGAEHLLVMKIVHAARKANIAATDKGILNKLMAWSKLIQEDFLMKTVDFHLNAGDEKLLLKLIDHVSKQNQLTAQLIQLLSKQQKTMEDLKSRLLKTDCSSACNNIALKQHLDKLEEMIAVQSSRRFNIAPDNKRMHCEVAPEAEPAPFPPNSLEGPSCTKKMHCELTTDTKLACIPTTSEAKSVSIPPVSLEGRSCTTAQIEAVDSIKLTVIQPQSIPCDVPKTTRKLEIKHLLKYHYDSKHFNPNHPGVFSVIAVPTFYDRKDTGKHSNLMKLMKMVWDQDPIKEYSDIFTQNLIPSKVSSVCSSFQRKIMETMASLEISLQTYSTEKEEKKAMQQIMQSSRMKPFVIGVANRYALFMERKKQWTNERASGDISSLNNSLVKRT